MKIETSANQSQALDGAAGNAGAAAYVVRRRGVAVVVATTTTTNITFSNNKTRKGKL